MLQSSGTRGCNSWKNSVIVSREQESRDYLTWQCEYASRLSEVESPEEYVDSMYYDRVFLDEGNSEADKKYFEFHDRILNRTIFIASKAVGLCRAFHEDKNIENVIHLIKKCNNHEHHTDMTARTRKWWFQNLINVALKLYDVPGNIVLCCNNGRSRSPSYLVAYLIIVHNISDLEARTVVGELLVSQRGETIDRFETLTPILNDIYERKYVCYASRI